MRSIVKPLLLMTMLLISGCINSPSLVVHECAWAKTIPVQRADVLTRPTKVAIVAHNQKVAELCGGSVMAPE